MDPQGQQLESSGILLQWGTWVVHFHGEVLIQLWLYWDVEKREQEDKGIFIWQPHFFL